MEEVMLVKKVQFSDLPEHRTPIFNYCRQLIKEGIEPSTRLEIYRDNEEWDVAVTSIGLGAKLTVIENIKQGPFFASYRTCRFSAQ